MAFLLLARVTGDISGDVRSERYGQAIKFYAPRRGLPILQAASNSDDGLIQAAKQWIDEQPGLEQPAGKPVIFRSGEIEMVMFVISQEWRRPDGRPSDWVTAWTSCSWGPPLAKVLIMARNWFANRPL